MDAALTQKFPFTLDRNLAKANCAENHVCTSCNKVVFGIGINIVKYDAAVAIFWCFGIDKSSLT